MGTLFGTDGIRGVANSYPMTPEMALQVGRAVAAVFRKEGSKPHFIIGQDTRISGDMFAHALVAGICSMGADAELVGVLPTPGIAHVTRASGARAGIVVSASHNPYQDNGIKIFDSRGFKLPDEKEAEIERLILPSKGNNASPSTIDTGCLRTHSGSTDIYIEFLKGCTAIDRQPTNSFKLILDCAHGATFQVAPRVFSGLGMRVEALNVRPDGKNINDGCGSQHPEGMARRVVEAGADLGLAFDGDGDRLIAVDDQGEVISGDRILAICASHLHLQKRLKNNTVVSTVMSNVGLTRSLKQLGIRHVMTQVGDRYVMEAMCTEGAVLGGEDSGHMIFSEHHTTGDGILTALMLTETIRSQGKLLSQLKAVMTPFPQVLINVPVKSKPAIDEVPEISEAIRKAQKELAEDGRVLVRYSGTEPICRVMVEGPNQERTQTYCRAISKAVKDAIG
jgi:phosphoglucosamine mutase